ncbi:MAG: sugar ABC transporter permease, partial [Oscillospiraceae bacterium]|nr:sugar ABC transporter permease [Oscillospiraceae bacterium]MDR2598733.1 sugar ABC transporter permease [Oscillospiraceae bacterium]
MRKGLGERIRHERVSYMMLAPYFILFFCFTVLPVLISIFFSFTYFDLHSMPQFIGWGNYT